MPRHLRRALADDKANCGYPVKFHFHGITTLAIVVGYVSCATRCSPSAARCPLLSPCLLLPSLDGTLLVLLSFSPITVCHSLASFSIHKMAATKEYTPKEVAAHAAGDDCFMVIQGKGESAAGATFQLIVSTLISQLSLRCHKVHP